MIAFDKYLPSFVRTQDFQKLSDYGLVCASPDIRVDLENCGFNICWGSYPAKGRRALIETGFFDKALHIDAHGLYANCSLNLPAARAEILDFQAPISAIELFNTGKIQTKIVQSKEQVSWDGIVVACQYANDRSISQVGSSKDYYQFIHDVCKKFGKRVLLKRHPVMMGNKEDLRVLEQICSLYGSTVGHVDISCINNAEFVYTYNSTFSVDCALRRIPVKQYAPGYFWQTGFVEYTQRNIESYDPVCNLEFNSKFLDFLIWKYCFHSEMDLDKIAEVMKIFAVSKKYFPLPVEMSYGSHLEKL